MEADDYFVANYVFPDALEGKIIIKIQVSVRKSENFYISNAALALVDTGASHSCITKELADQLGVSADGTSTIETATGIETVPRYPGVDFTLIDGNGEKMTYENLEVNECFGGRLFDCIIGLDILRTGDMVISNAKGKGFFSFRTPSGKFHVGFSSENGEVKSKDIPLSEWEKFHLPEDN